MPYLGLYLKSLGFMAAQIGVVFAVVHGTKLISPSILAWFSSGLSNRMRFIQGAALISTLAFSFFIYQQEFLNIILLTFVFSFFWNGMLPQFESITLTKLGTNTHVYSRIRLWGSVGFILTVAGVGGILYQVGLARWPWLVCLCLGAIFLSSVFLNESRVVETSKKTHSLTAVLKNKKIIALFAVVFLMQASHGVYYAFFSILLDKLGYDATQIGQLWSLGVLAEIGLFLVMWRIFMRVTLHLALVLSLSLTIIRWLLIAWFSDSLFALLLAQILHAASYGAFHVICIQLTHRYFQGALHGKGQALYSSVGYGAGSMFGGLMAGVLWDDLGAAWVFSIAAFLSALALLITWLWVERNNADPLPVSGGAVDPI